MVQCNKKTQNVIGQEGKKLVRPITSWPHVSSSILRVILREPHRRQAALRRSHSGPLAARLGAQSVCARRNRDLPFCLVPHVFALDSLQSRQGRSGSVGPGAEGTCSKRYRLVFQEAL